MGLDAKQSFRERRREVGGLCSFFLSHTNLLSFSFSLSFFFLYLFVVDLSVWTCCVYLFLGELEREREREVKLDDDGSLDRRS